MSKYLTFLYRYSRYTQLDTQKLIHIINIKISAVDLWHEASNIWFDVVPRVIGVELILKNRYIQIVG